MGAGKSTIGRRLAEVMSMTFIDSDQVIEERTGVDISTIFDIEGEEGFRKREATVIDELTQRDNIVLATGGGAILKEANQQCLASRGMVIYLRVSVEQQLLRLQHDKSRPLLQPEAPEVRLKELLKIREPLYIDASDIIVETNHLRSSQIVKQIQNKLREYANAHPLNKPRKVVSSDAGARRTANRNRSV